MKKFSLRKILVPIDFSEMSLWTVEIAGDFARRFNAELALVHIENTLFSSVFMAPTPLLLSQITVMEKEAAKRMQRQLRDFAARLKLSPDACRVLTAAPIFAGICQLERQLGTDLVIMPTHGHTGLKHALLGSTAERVVQHSPAPVLVVRKRGLRLRKILVPVDYSGCSLEALRYALDFSRATGSQVVVLNVADIRYAYTSDGYAMYDLTALRKAAKKEAEQQMRRFVRASKLGAAKFETAVRVGAPVNEICAFAAEDDVDLILTPTHGRSGLNHVLIGSVAEQVVRHADRSVLVVPSHPAARALPLSQRKTRAAIRCGIRATPKFSRRNSIAGPDRQLRQNPFPERRKTNRFRERHSS